jgi:hypothetical protein
MAWYQGWVDAGTALQARRTIDQLASVFYRYQHRNDQELPLGSDVRQLGGEGVVIAGVQMRARERDCPAAVGRRDHVVEVTFTGTAIVRFSPARNHDAGPAVAIMPLGSQHRQGRL